MSRDFFNKITRVNKKYVTAGISPKKPHPISSDYNRGWFYRYFCKRVNSNVVYEIDKTQYMEFRKNPFILVVKLKWQISGFSVRETVSNMNIKRISNGTSIISELGNYLFNTTEYYKP